MFFSVPPINYTPPIFGQNINDAYHNTRCCALWILIFVPLRSPSPTKKNKMWWKKSKNLQKNPPRPSFLLLKTIHKTDETMMSCTKNLVPWLNAYLSFFKQQSTTLFVKFEKTLKKQKAAAETIVVPRSEEQKLHSSNK